MNYTPPPPENQIKWYYKRMPRKYTDEEYAKILPKKQVGTAVIFLNANGEILIVKPNYRDGWLVPGGATDENESPLHCAIREVKEEIGLDIPEIKLVGIYAEISSFCICTMGSAVTEPPFNNEPARSSKRECK